MRLTAHSQQLTNTNGNGILNSHRKASSLSRLLLWAITDRSGPPAERCYWGLWG